MSESNRLHAPLTITEQVAESLRGGVREGRWAECMPGKVVLARELGVSPMTVSRALSVLESEGIISSGGPGSRRRIQMAKITAREKRRVTILLNAAEDAQIGYMVELRYQLIEAGWIVDIAHQTLTSLKMDRAKVAHFAAKTETDAWVVLGGSREVLKWFSAQPTPAFALFGEALGLPIATTGPDNSPVIRAVVRRLLVLGHSRIVMIGHPYQNPPERGAVVEAFLDELAIGGIATGPYNHPEWSGNAAGLLQCLNALFSHTPPTALVLGAPELFHPVKAHLAQKGLLAPRDVSLFTLDDDPSFRMCDPSVSCTSWDHDWCVKRTVHWINGVARGVNELEQHLLKVKMVSGGTMGPVPHKPSSPVPKMPPVAARL